MCIKNKNTNNFLKYILLTFSFKNSMQTSLDRSITCNRLHFEHSHTIIHTLNSQRLDTAGKLPVKNALLDAINKLCYNLNS